LGLVVAVLVGYVLGALPFGYLAGKLRGVDIRRLGSRGTGATNTLRVLGPAFAIAVAVLDVGKGVAAALLGPILAPTWGAWGAAGAGLAAVVGHSWSVFLGFGGGKGVATAAGVIMTLMPSVGFLAAPLFFVVVAASRYVSLGSITAAALVGILGIAWPAPLPIAYRCFLVSAAAVVLLRHRSNLARLRAGTESRFGQRVKVAEKVKAEG
jgi:glycerol-3-phosphate acyltransferase PlsY